MKKALGVLTSVIVTIAMVFAMIGCSGNSELQSDIDKLTEIVKNLTEKVDDLTDENGALNKRVDDLTDENDALNKRVDDLNVFWTDKAEYAEDETMTVYFKNQPVLKIRISFNNIHKTAFWGGSSLNHSLRITSLCADIYAESIVDTSFVVSDAGYFVRDPSSGLRLCEKDEETPIAGHFSGSEEDYDNSTWFDLVICVPGTPFELARFKNVSYTR